MNTDALLRTLIVDDEPLAIQRMQVLCDGLPDVQVAGIARDGRDALGQISRLRPDLVLLDIAMPGLDGLAVAHALNGEPHRPAVIFCTALHEHAIAAFDVAADDYLLKPIGAERLTRAVRRVRERLPTRPAPATSPWLSEIWVPHRGDMIRLDVADLRRIEAERDYIRLHSGGRSYLLHLSLTAIERRLDPAAFLRLHRSAIVRRDQIVRLRHDGLGAWTAVLGDGVEQRVSRTFLQQVKERLYRS